MKNRLLEASIFRHFMFPLLLSLQVSLHPSSHSPHSVLLGACGLVSRSTVKVSFYLEQVSAVRLFLPNATMYLFAWLAWLRRCFLDGCASILSPCSYPFFLREYRRHRALGSDRIIAEPNRTDWAAPGCTRLPRKRQSCMITRPFASEPKPCSCLELKK